jgi:AraC-like DNA-binding protein
MDGNGAGARIRTFEHDSPLGRWRVSTWQPDPRLGTLVAAMWFGEGQVRYARDRILPSGQSQLLINLGPTQYRVEPGPPERRVPFRDVWYSGLHETPIDTEAPHGNALLGVAFVPAGAWPWLGAGQRDFAGQVLPLADALGDGVLALHARLLDTPDLVARFELVEAWLISRLSPRRVVHPAVRWAIDRIEASAGQEPVGKLARETGFTRKHLTHLFLREVGLTPKELARVHRFRAALALLGDADAVPWAAIAAQCGYYDQSHLTRDFHAFCGFTPADFARHARPDAVSVVVR